MVTCSLVWSRLYSVNVVVSVSAVDSLAQMDRTKQKLAMFEDDDEDNGIPFQVRTRYLVT